MSSPGKTSLGTQIKILAVCLLAEVALCGLMNSVRLHFAAMADEMSRDLGRLAILYLTFSLVAANAASIISAILAVSRKTEHRRFAALALPLLLLATSLIAAICLFGGAQNSAAAALVSFVSALAVERFVPGKIWPPETLK